MRHRHEFLFSAIVFSFIYYCLCPSCVKWDIEPCYTYTHLHVHCLMSAIHCRRFPCCRLSLAVGPHFHMPRANSAVAQIETQFLWNVALSDLIIHIIASALFAALCTSLDSSTSSVPSMSRGNYSATSNNMKFVQD